MRAKKRLDKTSNTMRRGELVRGRHEECGEDGSKRVQKGQMTDATLVMMMRVYHDEED